MTKQKIWLDGKLVDWDKANFHLLTHTLHYGSGAFEGIRAYATASGPAVFRLDDHLKRFVYSAKVFGLKMPYKIKELKGAIIDLLKINRLEEGYIRPIVFYGNKMGLVPTGAPIHVAIAAWPWGKYLAKDRVAVKISKFIRLHPKSTVIDAKLSGHYANSIVASMEAKDLGFDEALLLDHEGNIAEGPGENIFFIKDRTLVTPQPGSILPGITRDSIKRIAKDLKYKLVEKKIRPAEIKNYAEAFFVGTAVEVCPIARINNFKFKGSEQATELQKTYNDTVRGKIKKYKKWLTYSK
ncbi:MAG: branched-chain amino acid transaminase [Candidatus Vogelbacteria bacterium]|nr:branched-chain amino acid transaminase [Candidatus Vogelbacteria bacterium]